MLQEFLQPGYVSSRRVLSRGCTRGLHASPHDSRPLLPEAAIRHPPIGTSAFRLTDRARVPTNLRISRPGPHADSHTSIPTTTRRRQPPTSPSLPTFFSSLLRPQQPICRTLLLARRSSLERARGPFRLRRPRSGTPWMTNRSPRKSVHPRLLSRNQFSEEDAFPMDECDYCAGSI